MAYARHIPPTSPERNKWGILYKQHPTLRQTTTNLALRGVHNVAALCGHLMAMYLSVVMPNIINVVYIL